MSHAARLLRSSIWRQTLRHRATGPNHFAPLLSYSCARSFHKSSIMSKEQIDELKKNPYFDKYADKIAKLQQYDDSLP